MKRAKRLKEGLFSFRNGVEPKVTIQDLLDHEVGEIPLPEDQAILNLAAAIHESRSTNCAISWAAQEEALAYYNENGLAKTLDRTWELLKV